ncbi:MAG TPA: hypothetical protein VK395_06260 [Gemmataceae bacterium]|nr:hypothetical protein [Gemmataceae bacterium]
MPEEQQPQTKYFYFVNATKYETDQLTVTGALIAAKIPDFDLSYSLFLEGEGGGHDQLITDDTAVSLNERRPRRFYTVPPAAFG